MSSADAFNQSKYDDTVQEESFTVPDVEVVYPKKSDLDPQLTQLLDAIHIDREGAPELQFTENAASQIAELRTSMRELLEADSKASVVAVRIGGKSLEDIKDLSRRIADIKKYARSIAGVLFMINPGWEDKSKDHGDDAKETTQRTIEYMLQNNSSDLAGVPMVPVLTKEYSFTAGLNGAAALIAGVSKQEGFTTENVMMVPMSGDVSLSAEDAVAFDQAVQVQESVLTARNLPDGTPSFTGTDAEIVANFKRYILDTATAFEDLGDLSGVEPGEPTSELIEAARRLSVGRNTFQAHSIKRIAEIGRFNVLCDAKPHEYDLDGFDEESVTALLKETEYRINGMEDWEFWKTAIELAIISDEELLTLAKSVIGYTDSSQNNAQQYSGAKTVREIAAAKLIAMGAAQKIPQELQEFTIAQS